MTVKVKWDADPDKTGLPDTGTDTKQYANTATSGTVTVTSEQNPAATVTVNFNLPLEVPAAPTLTPDKTTVDSGGDATARTITVAGAGFPVSAAGTVTLHPGAPGSGGTAVVTANVTTDAAGAFTGAAVVVPAAQAAGDYHLVGTVGAAVADANAITVTATAAAAITPDKTEVDSSGDATARTISVTGTGFPASTAGTVALHPGAPGSGGTAVVSAPFTSDASGAVPATAVVVPEAQAAGDYHLVAVAGATTVDDTAITVTATAAPVLTPDKTTVNSTGDATARTVTVAGTGFVASSAGNIAINTGAPGSGGTEVVTAAVTSDATGAFTGAALEVPAAQAAGDYHILTSGAIGVSDDTTLTVTDVEAAITPDKTTISVAGDETARTLLVSGTGFPANSTVVVAVNAGAPGSGGEMVLGEEATADATGSFADLEFIVDTTQTPGDYHIMATAGDVVVDNTALTITA